MTNLNQKTIKALAGSIREAYETGKTIPPVVGQISAGDADTAYMVQAENTKIWLSQGRRISGYKIGLTSPVVQKQLAVNQPDFGTLFADMAVCDSEDIKIDRLIQPRVEAEVAFVMAKDLSKEHLTVADVISATEYVLPAIEIVDSRIQDWKITIVDTIADNASSALFVLGNDPKLLTSLDLRTVGMTMSSDNEPISTGVGAACLGHPVNAALWLAKKLTSVGTYVKEGDIILSGALGPMVSATPGKVYEARINTLGSVRAVFETG